MVPWIKGIFIILVFWSGAAFAQTTPTEAQKLRSHPETYDEEPRRSNDGFQQGETTKRSRSTTVRRNDAGESHQGKPNSGVGFGMTSQSQQADDLEDKSAQAIDDGNMSEGLDFMVRAIRLDPSPMRRMNYGSILFGNGVSVFKDSDQEKGKKILRQAEVQLHKAIEAFNPNKDQVYLSQCYFLLGEMYLNAFGDKPKAKEYYTKAAGLNDYTGAKDALNKLSI